MSREVILELKSKHQKIKDKLSKLRIVKAGDYVLSEDHNKMVEILGDLSTLLDEIIKAIPPPPPKVISPILLSLRTFLRNDSYGKDVTSGVTIRNPNTTQEYLIEGQPEETASFTTLKTLTSGETESILGLNSDMLNILVNLKDIEQHEVYSKTVWETIIEYIKTIVTVPKYNTLKPTHTSLQCLIRRQVGDITLKSTITTLQYFIEGQPEETAPFSTLKSLKDYEQELIKGVASFTTVKTLKDYGQEEILAVDETVREILKALSGISSYEAVSSATPEAFKPLTTIEAVKIEEKETGYVLKDTYKTSELTVMGLSKFTSVLGVAERIAREVHGLPALGTVEKTVEVKKVVW